MHVTAVQDYAGCDHGHHDEDLDRENDHKTSSVHFLRFELSPAACQAVRAGAGVRLGCDHTHYPAHMSIPPDTLAMCPPLMIPDADLDALLAALRSGLAAD